MIIQKIVCLYFRGSYMTGRASGTPTVKAATPAEARQIVLKEVGAKWGKFSEQELDALKDKADLVSQVVAKYRLERGQARRDVDLLLKGRPI
jgi:hypothetical protein